MVAAKKRLRVYCETTFWSYLAGRQTTDEKIARNQAFTLKWWQEIAPKCDHMANLVTMPKTAAIVAKAGYECPVIITPDEFLAKKEAFGL